MVFMLRDSPWVEVRNDWWRLSCLLCDLIGWSNLWTHGILPETHATLIQSKLNVPNRNCHENQNELSRPPVNYPAHGSSKGPICLNTVIMVAIPASQSCSTYIHTMILPKLSAIHRHDESSPPGQRRGATTLNAQQLDGYAFLFSTQTVAI